MSFRRVIAITVLSALMFAALPALAQDGPTAAEYGTVLNLSGKQRMLTQKMSKEIMLIALEADKAKNVANLTKTAALFDKTLHGLRDGDADLGLPPTSSKRIVRQLDKVQTIWADFKVTVDQVVSSGRATPDQVASMAAANLPLLKQMNKCVKLYEKDASGAGLESDPGLAVTINLSGKQRMLTQKMSKEFLLVAYGHDREGNQLNLRETFSLFERTLTGLLDGDATLDLPGTRNPAIREQLGVVQGLWASFKPIVENGSTAAEISKGDITQIASANLPLLKQMNKAVGMYEKEAAAAGGSQI